MTRQSHDWHERSTQSIATFSDRKVKQIITLFKSMFCDIFKQCIYECNAGVVFLSLLGCLTVFVAQEIGEEIQDNFYFSDAAFDGLIWSPNHWKYTEQFAKENIGVSEEDCVKLCSESNGCNGFFYNPEEQKYFMCLSIILSLVYSLKYTAPK
jgi:hypothetical protein